MQQVFVVVGHLKAIPAGYNILGVCKTKKDAEKLRQDRESNPELHSNMRWEHIEIWTCDLT